MNVSKPSLLVVFVILTINLITSATEPSQNSAEDLLQPPRVYNMIMTSDGKYAASIAPIGKKRSDGIVIINLDTLKIEKSFDWPGSSIDQITWTTNKDLAFCLSKWGQFVNGVYSVNVDRRKVFTLLTDDVSATFLDPVPDEPYSWIWIHNSVDNLKGLAKIRSTKNAVQKNFNDSGYKVPPTSQNNLIFNRIKKPKGEIFGWGIDKNHIPRIVQRFHKDKLEYLHRYNSDEEWKPLKLDPEEWNIELFSKNQNKFYISGYHGEETKGLYPYDIENDKIGDLIYRDDYYDFPDTVRYIHKDKQLVGFRYMKATPQIVWMAPEMLKIQNAIDTSLPKRVNIFIDCSKDFTRHIIYSYSDKIPPEYYLFDIKKGSLSLITKSAPWLNYEQLSSTKPFHFKTSDGLKLEGYITRPKNQKPPYAMVCLVHGGPWSRDTGGFNDEAQFLVNRGYAVLRVNYRGSTGYGKNISENHAYDFKKMHDDITEAVKTAIKFKLADPNKIAIMGASFGGYAALCGATFEPELYQCAISNMGVFDWEELIKSRKQKRYKYFYKKYLEELGNPKESQELFEEISPIYHTENIKIPILVIHGKEDNNVSIKQSKHLVKALKKNNIQHETMFISGEGHNIFEFKKRLKVYNKIADFLDENLK